MRVTKIETFVRWIDWCNWLLVKVTTDEGIHGWGEGSLHGAVGAVDNAIEELGGILSGIELDRGVPSVWHELYNAWRWRGGPVLSTATAALDIALWDIEGKRLGVPVYRLLGGPYRERIRGYASHWLSGVTTPEGAYEQAQEAVRRGFNAFKWSPFSLAELRQNENATLRHAAELMAAAREGAGEDVDIFIECAEVFSPRTAIRAAELLAPYRPGWFEEPIPFENPQEFAALRRSFPVPIATGERLLSRAAFRDLFERGGVDIAQPDVMHAAGISELMRIGQLADTYLVSVAPHNPGGPVCMMASLHVAAALPNFYILEQMEKERELRDRVSGNPLTFRDGYFELPTAPGLGVEPDIELLSEQRPQFMHQPPSGLRESRWH